MTAGAPTSKPRSRRKRRFLLAVLALFLLYALWLGYHVVSFHTYPTRLWAPWTEIEGIYHVHSRYSDGRAEVPWIAAIASRANVDFLILTDHGSPNHKSLDSQGWYDGVLVLAGSEMSTSRGHLVGLGFEPEHEPFPQNAEEAAREINRRGGLAVISHPYYDAIWTWGPMEGYGAMDIINGNSLLKKNFLRSLPYLPALLFKPELAVVKMMDEPERELTQWDTLNRTHRLYGFFSSDAHLFYWAMFALLRVHIYLNERFSNDFQTARAQVLQALHSGKFYNAVDVAAQARGFRFWAEKNERKISMGRSVIFEPGSLLRVRAPYDFAVEVRIIKDGQVVQRSKKNEVVFDVTGPGVYRVEVYLRARSPLNPRIPWIVSNPIFFTEASP